MTIKGLGTKPKAQVSIYLNKHPYNIETHSVKQFKSEFLNWLLIFSTINVFV